MKLLWNSRLRAVWDRLWGWLALTGVGACMFFGVLWLLHKLYDVAMPVLGAVLEWCGRHLLFAAAVLIVIALIVVMFEGRFIGEEDA